MPGSILTCTYAVFRLRNRERKMKQHCLHHKDLRVAHFLTYEIVITHTLCSDIRVRAFVRNDPSRRSIPLVGLGYVLFAGCSQIISVHCAFAYLSNSMFGGWI